MQGQGDGEHVLVQIASHDGDAAVTVTVRPVADGVNVAVGQAKWLGSAAALAQAGAGALFNPFSLLGRISDIVENVNEPQPARAGPAGHRRAHLLGRRRAGRVARQDDAHLPVLRRATARDRRVRRCGAPLGAHQPRACPKCGQ
jgi:hypothetical protein